MEYLKEVFKKTVNLRKYNNVVEAAFWAKLFRRCSGTSVKELQSLPGNRIVKKFSPVGFIFFILWNSLYFYCVYKTIHEDQSIIRMLYKTKLKRYGDDFERISSLIYVLITMYLTPFKLSGNRILMQNTVDIDAAIEKSGDIINYNKIGRRALRVTFIQMAVYLIRLACLNIALSSEIVVPVEKVFQVVYSDALALITTSLYCYYMIIFRDRFKWINKTLRDVKKRNSWEHKIFIRRKVPTNMIKVVELQDRLVCEKIKTCARIYSSLYNVSMQANKTFGLALLFIMIHYLDYIILYLFYFMEANAIGLFHDLNRYCDFVIYTFWQIALALVTIFLITFMSESTVAQAKEASYIIHEIINEDFGSTINSEAMQFSIQLLHETPVFTVCGLFNLNYAFLQEGARSVLTYLVILLQFVTENSSTI